MHIPIGLQAVAMAVGVLYVLMALTVWFLLLRRHPKRALALWSVGSLCAGAGLVWIGTSGAYPSATDYLLAVSLMQFSMWLRVGALRLDLGLPLHAQRGLLLAVVTLVVYQISNLTGDEQWRLGVGTAILVSGNAALAWYAYLAGRQIPSRNGTLLAWAEAAAAGGLLMRFFLGVSNHTPAVQAVEVLHFAALLTLGSAAVVYSSLGYLGMAVDRLQALGDKAQAEKHEAQNRRDEAEKAAEDLRSLLAQRDRLSAEREQLLQLLAHEIRQPLHNASGALQAAERVISAGASGDTALAPQDAAAVGEAPLQRAQALLGDLHSVLDNTLAASGFFTRSVPLSLQEVELAWLLELALGDLRPEHRSRVRLQLETDLRSIEVEHGLMRLALRNLLRNAFTHGGPDVQVVLHASEREEPPAVVLAVVDNGVGAAPQRLVAWVPNPAQSPASRPFAGLGLYLVREVAALHGGSLEVAANHPQGLVFRLVLPLPGSFPAPEPLAS